MIKHLIGFTLKQLSKQRLVSAINLFGLATAMGVCLMIFLYVYHELSFDRFHADARNINRLGTSINIQGNIQEFPFTSPAIGPDLLETFPEITAMARLSHQNEINIWINERHVSVNQTFYADSTFFDVFSFKLLSGNPRKALADPFSIVLTRSLANDLFPDQEAIGKIVRINDIEQRFTVSGVAANSPDNSHIAFQALISFETLKDLVRARFNDWDANIAYYTYVVAAPGTDMESLSEKTANLIYEKVNHKFEGMGITISLDYLPILKIRLHSPYSNEIKESGTARKVMLFSLIAIFVLFIAGFNYVNLSIAHSGKRAREVGMRKVLGAHNQLLRKQFYMETLFFTAISFLGALFIAELALPAFNHILDVNLKLLATPWWFFVLAILIFVVFFGFSAGIYPAWYMTSFEPVKILKGEFWAKPGRFPVRNLLLLLQFIVSLVLIVCTLVIFLQIRFMQTKDYGYNYKNLLAIQVPNTSDGRFLRQAFEKHPWVKAQSIASTYPGGLTYMEGVIPQDAEPGFMSYKVWIDPDYFEALGIRLDQGSVFNSEGGLDAENVIVNQTFIRRSGWIDPLGKTIERSGVYYKVIGVIKDYHFQSLHKPVEPMMINVLEDPLSLPGRPFWLLLRYESEASALLISTLLQEWKSLFPQNTLAYYFVSDIVGAQYTEDRSFGRLFMAFTFLAIIIAMLGVMGLSSFAAQQRQKETGIRKVLGATNRGILLKLAAEYLIWIALAAIVALPLAYWFMEKWLAGFAYAISFPWWTMAVSLVGMTMIALFIVISQAWATTRINPAEVLKTE